MQGLGQLVHVGLPAQLFGQLIPGFQGLVGNIPQAAADPDGVVVPQIPANFADDHGHGIGGKAHVQRGIEIVQRLDEPDAAHLKQIVHVFAPVAEALNNAQHQTQISPDKFLPGVEIAAVHQRKQLPHTLVGQNGQGRRIYAADFHLVDRHVGFLPCRLSTGSMGKREGFHSDSGGKDNQRENPTENRFFPSKNRKDTCH